MVAAQSSRTNPFPEAESEEEAAALEALAAAVRGGDYSDVVRTGCMIVNGEELRWTVIGAKSADCRHFVRAVWPGFLRAGQSVGLEDLPTVRRAIYWACKATSADYVVACLYKRLRDLAGDVKIDPPGVRYAVDVLPGPKLSVSLRWLSRDNLRELCPCPETGISTIKGTLGSLAASFDLPPPPGCRPCYNLELTINTQSSSAREAAFSPGATTRLHPDTDLEPRRVLPAAPPAQMIGESACEVVGSLRLRLARDLATSNLERCLVWSVSVGTVHISAGRLQGSTGKHEHALCLPIRRPDLREELVMKILDADGSGDVAGFGVPVSRVVSFHLLSSQTAPLRMHKELADDRGSLTLDLSFVPRRNSCLASAETTVAGGAETEAQVRSQYESIAAAGTRSGGGGTCTCGSSRRSGSAPGRVSRLAAAAASISHRLSGDSDAGGAAAAAGRSRLVGGGGSGPRLPPKLWRWRWRWRCCCCGGCVAMVAPAP